MDINMQEIIKQNMEEQIQLLKQTMKTDYADKTAEAAECILQAISTGHKVLIAGNGGSAADAQHMAAELVVRFEKDREGYPAMALTTDSSILSAGGNDYGFEAVYERQVQAMGAEGDVFIAISTSGNSENIVRAVHMAGNKKMKVIGMTGQTGGRMKELCDIVLCVPHDRTARIQEIHEHTIHTLCQLVEQKM